MSTGHSHGPFNTFLWGLTATVFLAIVLWAAGSSLDFATGAHLTLFAKLLAPRLGVSLDSVGFAIAFLSAVAVMFLALLIERRATKRAFPH